MKADGERLRVVRQCQAERMFPLLKAAVSGCTAYVLMGDMNWRDPVKGGNKWDGELAAPPNWVDAWTNARTAVPSGFTYTYDGTTNKMKPGRIKYRADRVLLHDCRHWKCERLQALGLEAIPGLTSTWTNPYSGAETARPVLPCTCTLCCLSGRVFRVCVVCFGADLATVHSGSLRRLRVGSVR